MRLISVVIATLNAENDLFITLDSLNNQTNKNFEVLLIDAGSKDNTIAVAKSYDLNYQNMISEPDSGISEAWNKALKLVSSSWLIFLNAGDCLHPKYIESALKNLPKKNSPVIYFCDVFKFNELGQITNCIKGQKPDPKNFIYSKLGFGHPGSLTNIEVFKKIGEFNIKYKIAMDSDFILRAYFSGVEFRYFESKVYMAVGGLSDRNYRRSLLEYYDSLNPFMPVKKHQLIFYLFFLPKLRGVYRFSRKNNFILRQLKHYAVFLINLLSSFLFFYFLRKIYFKALGFKLSANSSVGMGFSFYRLGNIEIGENSVINRNCLFDNRAKIKIGRNVSISRGVNIYTGSHDIHSHFFEMNLRPVNIEDNVVIFSQSIIAPGVSLGKGSIVYPGSVVFKDVEPMAIMSGNPATKIGCRASAPKYNFNYKFPMAM
jgi:acetyltransferase-like isoleucine patch superfamily enzyme